MATTEITITTNATAAHKTATMMSVEREPSESGGCKYGGSITGEYGGGRGEGGGIGGGDGGVGYNGGGDGVLFSITMSLMTKVCTK